jgi:hypothetical protein
MFADLALAARIEGAEARLTSESTRALAPDGSGAFARALGAGAAAFVRPGSPMNKIIGAGLDQPIDEPALAELERLYRERDEPVRVELCTLAHPDAGRRLTERGYHLLGFENVLGRAVAQASGEADGVRVERIDAARLPEWTEVLVEGFACPDETGVVVDRFALETIRQAVDDSTRAGGYCRYLARRDGQAAGAASMWLDGGVALLTGAATLARHRRRGVQSALLARRLADAAEAGADLLVMTTGGGTRSQHNAMRRGFSLLYARAILVLPTRGPVSASVNPR